MLTTYAKRAVEEFNQFPTATARNLLQCIQFWILERETKAYRIKCFKNEIICLFNDIKIFTIKIKEK